MKLKVLKEIEAKTLIVEVGVRYWEDATIDGVEDVGGDLVPCRVGDNWCPRINLENGQILNWRKGVSANIHYKVCDDGRYTLLDENEEVITSIDGYVPGVLDLYKESFGDYIILKIDTDGIIQDWNNKASLRDFEYLED